NRIPGLIESAISDFEVQNAKLAKKNSTILPETDLDAIKQILKAKPIQLGVIDALDTWVHENLQEAGRMPGTDEWKMLKHGPLNGKIGMSFALQWRFNFGRIFSDNQDLAACLSEEFI
ncbi:MAG TPA: hypothetical protein VK327_17595, partial [Candidatus Paceibacterota bacterium]|nr:hypothetical protein [Candidatus Paceibacterota bacterium]